MPCFQSFWHLGYFSLFKKQKFSSEIITDIRFFNKKACADLMARAFLIKILDITCGLVQAFRLHYERVYASYWLISVKDLYKLGIMANFADCSKFKPI